MCVCVCVCNVLDGVAILDSVYKIKNVKYCPESCDESSIVVYQEVILHLF